jgi:hypothetical protein
MAPKSVILALCDFLKGDGEDTPIAIQKKPASDAKSPSNPKKRPAAALVLSKKQAAAMDAMADDSEALTAKPCQIILIQVSLLPSHRYDIFIFLFKLMLLLPCTSHSDRMKKGIGWSFSYTQAEAKQVRH